MAGGTMESEVSSCTEHLEVSIAVEELNVQGLFLRRYRRIVAAWKWIFSELPALVRSTVIHQKEDAAQPITGQD
ncbi:hypothetical protein GDO81_017723 [Engystomops pustulosus]|uniref:Uncharacterized protein n=1 Tax=Engystomops pustulosus TaxID=76066 RepID=A0AAV7A467_ENGPU|nr:hypothetical protein GDO81_017723 [Engystomops pustulosus]